MRDFSATEELVTLTKQTKVDQCERVRVNGKPPHLPLCVSGKNKVVLEKLRATQPLQTLILVDKHKAWASGGIGLGTVGRLPRSSRKVRKCQFGSLAVAPQNVCIALPERYIQSGESDPRLGPPAYPQHAGVEQKNESRTLST